MRKLLTDKILLCIQKDLLHFLKYWCNSVWVQFHVTDLIFDDKIVKKISLNLKHYKI